MSGERGRKGRASRKRRKEVERGRRLKKRLTSDLLTNSSE
jgi:hypothetical protein